MLFHGLLTDQAFLPSWSILCTWFIHHWSLGSRVWFWKVAEIFTRQGLVYGSHFFVVTDRTLTFANYVSNYIHFSTSASYHCLATCVPCVSLVIFSHVLLNWRLFPFGTIRWKRTSNIMLDILGFSFSLHTSWKLIIKFLVSALLSIVIFVCGRRRSFTFSLLLTTMHIIGKTPQYQSQVIIKLW